MSEFIPNSFQLPNIYVDRLFPLLTAQEMRVVIYIARRTYGFGKLADSISLNQFVDGIATSEGAQLDHGAGVSRQAAITALKTLQGYRVVEMVAPGVKFPVKARRATIYALQLNSGAVDWAGLERRQQQNSESMRQRKAKK